MNKTYSIEPANKKSIEIIETWYNEELDQSVEITDVWRWGRWYITTDDEKLIEQLKNQREGQTLVLNDYEVEFDYTDDGVGRWLEFSDDPDGKLEEEFEKIFDDEGFMGLEDAGWEHEDTESYIFHELVITEVE